MRCNVIYERAAFNYRFQQEGESAEKIIISLYTLAESCEYVVMEELIGDKLVVGIKDTTLSKRLQLDPDLMLEKAKKAVRQKEAVHEYQHVLREGEGKKYPIKIDAVQLKQKHQQQSTRTKKVVNISLKAKSTLLSVEVIYIHGRAVQQKMLPVVPVIKGTLQITVPHQEGLFSTGYGAHCSGCRIACSR